MDDSNERKQHTVVPQSLLREDNAIRAQSANRNIEPDVGEILCAKER